MNKIKAEKWSRINYTPSLPIGDNNSRVTSCKTHIALSKRAASEGIVLLKNEGDLLPLMENSKVAVFGKAHIDYVICGGGSGEIFTEYSRNIYEGLKMNGIEVFEKLSLYYAAYVEDQYKAGAKSGMLEEPEVPDELLKEAAEFTDTAIISINRYSGEGWDRKNDGEDKYFDLSDTEKEMVKKVCSKFKKIIVLLNTGAMIETSWFADNKKIGAALMIWQGGMEGAVAAAEVLTGKINPSGKLVDTCAADINDYPSTAGFHESEDYVKYTEDIFVGYRYFETVPGKKKRVVYPFGFGLSYTGFEISDIDAFDSNGKIYISLNVKNIGKYAGKEVIQVYYGAPKGKLEKPAKELCAFQKTKLIEPGGTQALLLSFDIDSMASYDDTGAIEKSAYVLEKGKYKIYLGNSVRDAAEIDYKYTLKENRIVEKLTEYCAPKNLGKRMLANGEYEKVKASSKKQKKFPCKYKCANKIPETDEDIKKLIDVWEGNISLDDFIAQLTGEEMAYLLHGIPNTGVANTNGMGGLDKYKIPPVMTADGPAGVRINPKTGVRTTGFPVATMLASTWNPEIVEKIGKAGALEAIENNLFIWLTPALNIHRSPLCGRNFEYYSEDPFVAGKMAAALVRGIQSQGIAATPKHFACNNKETNRVESDSIVSERALREIYLKGFEICVKESSPKFIMTSYNIINGVRASENAELLTGILRGEWGYKGIVVTDWANHGIHSKEVIAGNDIRMPRSSTTDLKEALEKGEITRDQLALSVKRLLSFILELD